MEPQAIILKEPDKKVKIKIQKFCPTAAHIWNYYQFSYLKKKGPVSATVLSAHVFFCFVVILILCEFFFLFSLSLSWFYYQCHLSKLGFVGDDR